MREPIMFFVDSLVKGFQENLARSQLVIFSCFVVRVLPAVVWVFLLPLMLFFVVPISE